MGSSKTNQTSLRILALSIFVSISVVAFLYWLMMLPDTDVDTARCTLQALVTAEAALLGFTVAALAFAMNMTATQARGLESPKIDFLQELTPYAPKLDELAEVYQERFNAMKSLPVDFKYQGMSHLTDEELLYYLSPFVSVAHRASRQKTTPQDPAISELESDTVQFFRIACGILLSPFCGSADASDSVVILSAKLRHMDVRYNIVRTANNLFDVRRAARRGMPLFVMFLVGSWLLSISTLSGLSGESLNVWPYAFAVGSAFVHATALAYYTDQLLSRYIQ